MGEALWVLAGWSAVIYGYFRMHDDSIGQAMMALLIMLFCGTVAGPFLWIGVILTDD